MRVLHMPVGAVILAAGDSSRMGYPKALLPIGDEIFLARIARTLRSAGLSDITVVVGRHSEEIRQRANHAGLRFILNARPELGQISSMQLAFEHMDPCFAAVMIWPVDQPAVSVTVIRGLIDAYSRTNAAVVMPTCGGRSGHPVVFRRDFCQKLLTLPPTSNPKGLIRRHMDSAVLFPTEETAILSDVDTPDDYYRLTGETLEEACRRMQSGLSPDTV